MATKKGTAIHHVVKEQDNFETTAKRIFLLIEEAQKNRPNSDRHLHLDIEGHRNENGGYDSDMFELQKEFIGFIMPYIKSVNLPLWEMTNKKPQINDLPKFYIQEEKRGMKL